MSLLFIVGVTWNFALILIIFKKRLYHNPSVLLLLNIVSTDLMLCLLVMPFSIISGFAGEYIFGNSDYARCQVCKFNFIVILLIIEGILTLLLSTIDRLIYLKKPLRYHSLITTKRIIIAIPITWIGGLILSLPPLFEFGMIGYEIKAFGICILMFNGASTVAPNFVYIILITALMLPCVIAIMIINIWTVCIIRKKTLLKIQRTIDSTNQTTSGRKHLTLKQQFTIARVFIAINITNIISWTPFIVLLVVRASLRSRPLSPGLASVGFLLFLTQPVLHPILQGFLVGKVRNEFKKCCNIMLRCRKKE